jgi:hypothetical protein
VVQIINLINVFQFNPKYYFELLRSQAHNYILLFPDEVLYVIYRSYFRSTKCVSILLLWVTSILTNNYYFPWGIFLNNVLADESPVILIILESSTQSVQFQQGKEYGKISVE